MYYRSKNPVQDWLDDETGKAELILNQKAENARKEIEIRWNAELAPATKMIKQLTGIDLQFGENHFGTRPEEDSPMGKAIAEAVSPFAKKREEIYELSREYRLRASLGKDADGKMSILKEFAKAVQDLVK